MDALQHAGRIEVNSRLPFASNTLVLITPIGSNIARWQDLALKAVRRVALSNPEIVPSGRYARETLTRRKLWNVVLSKAVFGENVRQVLTYVANGDADAGFVFRTDAQREKRRVKIVAAAVPGNDHAPIVYPAAVVRQGPNPAAARRFLAFLQREQARKILIRHGFGVLPHPRRVTRP
jgi:molybdate transport system substrate-binding protein